MLSRKIEKEYFWDRSASRLLKNYIKPCQTYSRSNSFSCLNEWNRKGIFLLKNYICYIKPSQTYPRFKSYNTIFEFKWMENRKGIFLLKNYIRYVKPFQTYPRSKSYNSILEFKWVQKSKINIFELKLLFNTVKELRSLRQTLSNSSKILIKV